MSFGSGLYISVHISGAGCVPELLGGRKQRRIQEVTLHFARDSTHEFCSWALKATSAITMSSGMKNVDNTALIWCVNPHDLYINQHIFKARSNEESRHSATARIGIRCQSRYDFQIRDSKIVTQREIHHAYTG